MLGNQMVVLRNILVVEIGNAKIKNNIHQKRKVKEREIQTVIFGTYHGLHLTFNTKYPKRLNEQIKREQQGQVFYKGALHGGLIAISIDRPSAPIVHRGKSPGVP